MRPRTFLAPVAGCGVALLATASLAAGTAGDVPRGPEAPKSVAPEVPVTAIDLRAERAQNSPMLAVDPTDARFVAAANRVDGPGFDCQLAVSGSGGRGWLPVRPVPRLPPGTERCYAPEVAFDGDGVLYYLFAGLRGVGNEPVGAFLTTSANRGRTFSRPRQVVGPGRFMVRLAIDRSHGPHGRLQLVWVEPGDTPALGGFAGAPNRIMASHSDDGGKTLSPPVQVSDAARSRVVAPALAVGAGGHVEVAYYDLGDDAVDYQGLEGPRWDGTWAVALSVSTDGGRTFGMHRSVDDDVVPPERVMLIFTMAPPALAAHPGAGGGPDVYVAWTDDRTGDWDVLLRHSADGGATWSPPLRVEDDPAGSGRHQYLPKLDVAPGGRVDAVFYDRRADPANLRNDVTYAALGGDGHPLSPNIRVTAEPSDSRTGARYPIRSARGMVEIGSRIAVVSSSSGALLAWTDTRTPHPGSLHQDVYATTVGPGATVPGGR